MIWAEDHAYLQSPFSDEDPMSPENVKARYENAPKRKIEYRVI